MILLQGPKRRKACTPQVGCGPYLVDVAAPQLTGAVGTSAVAVDLLETSAVWSVLSASSSGTDCCRPDSRLQSEGLLRPVTR